MSGIKKHYGFLIFFAIVIFIYLGSQIFMREAFIGGDSYVQFYPWMKVYAESIKGLGFPFWTRYMNSGFPLMAEGQTGGFYPLNILIFFLLPFKLAYNYSVVLHFVLAGLFTYLYTRRLGADQWGGSLAALLFCFGSAYAGCFYNIITLKTLAWFPLVLLLFELYFDKQRLIYILLAGIICGFQCLAGFIQMAVYSGLFYIIYFIYKAMAEKAYRRARFSALILFLFISTAISLPQVILTCQLSRFSGREAATPGFALWGSFSPLGLLGLVFPYQTLSRSHFYIGILSLFFVIYSLYSIGRQRSLRGLVLMLLLSVFLAMGKYNPLYAGALRLSGLYIFRNPSKFLFFAAFALSALAGLGLTRCFNDQEGDRRRKALLIFRWLLIACGLISLCEKLLLNLCRGRIMELGGWYVRRFILNRAHHRYDIDFYLHKVENIYNDIAARFLFSDIYVILSWALVIIALLVLPLLLRRRLKQAAVLIIFIDLMVFSGYGIGFRGNIRPFTALIPDTPALLEMLKSDSDLYRILPFGLASGNMPNWALPNANITYGIDSIASYTPLASKLYRDRLAGLEVVDDSLGLGPSNKQALIENLDIIRLLNVKYLVSTQRLDLEFLDMAAEENGVFLYRLKVHLPRVFFTTNIDGKISRHETKRLEILNYDSGLLEAEISTKEDGFLVFSEAGYPGWSAYIDGKKTNIIPVKGMVQSIRIEEGSHEAVFRFTPRFWKVRQG